MEESHAVEAALKTVSPIIYLYTLTRSKKTS